jgi:hypothetical protein
LTRTDKCLPASTSRSISSSVPDSAVPVGVPRRSANGEQRERHAALIDELPVEDLLRALPELGDRVLGPRDRHDGHACRTTRIPILLANRTLDRPHVLVGNVRRRRNWHENCERVVGHGRAYRVSRRGTVSLAESDAVRPGSTTSPHVHSSHGQHWECADAELVRPVHPPGPPHKHEVAAVRLPVPFPIRLRSCPRVYLKSTAR